MRFSSLILHLPPSIIQGIFPMKETLCYAAKQRAENAMIKLKPTICLALLFLISALPSLSQFWPQFRGPRAGVASGANLPEKWSATENIAWKTDIPGRGWSSPIVSGNRVFLTSVVNKGETEAPKKGLYFGGNREQPPPSEHEWKLFCLDLYSGMVLWDRIAFHGQPKTARHLKNSYASETPVTDGERVYALFGNVGVYCFDLNGKSIWTK